MKGILICGGTGSRLRPLTEITNKSLLPVYDRPLVEYPLRKLLDAGITDMMVISGNEHIDQMASYLGSGGRFGCKFTYRVQDRPGGIAQALGMAEEFSAGDSVCAILGDNVYFDNLAPTIRAFQGGAHIFLKEVPDPERFGVAEIETRATRHELRERSQLEAARPNRTLAGRGSSKLEASFRILSIEEKPLHPKSNYAVTGCYLYDNRCFSVVRNLRPSDRGELEITDVSRWFLDEGTLSATILEDEWIDAGTFESLHRAAVMVRERKQLAIGNWQEATSQKLQATSD